MKNYQYQPKYFSAKQPNQRQYPSITPASQIRVKRNYYIKKTDPQYACFRQVSGMISNVWKHFKRDINNQSRVLCQYCDLVMYITASNTSQMLNHLRSKHEGNDGANRRPSTSPAMDNKMGNQSSLADDIRIKHVYNKKSNKNDIFEQEEEQSKAADHENNNKVNDDKGQNEDKVKIQQERQSKLQQEQADSDPMIKPSKIRIVRNRGPKKLRGPRGPYRKRQSKVQQKSQENDNQTDKNYWSSLIKQSNETLKSCMPLQSMNGTLSVLSPTAYLYHNNYQIVEPKPQLTILRSPPVKNIRAQIKQFMHSLPYDLSLPQITTEILKNYSFPISICVNMLKKYHWVTTINDKKCLNKMKSYYRHQVVVRMRKQKDEDKGKDAISDEEEEDESQNYEKKWNKNGNDNAGKNVENIRIPQLVVQQQPIVFITTHKMRQNYRFSGSIIHLFFYSCLFNSRTKQSKIIYFTSQNKSTELVVYGVLILRQQTYQLYRQGLQYFLCCMGHDVPTIMIRNGNQGGKILEDAIRDIGKYVRRKIKLVTTWNCQDVSRILDLAGKLNLKFTYPIKDIIINCFNQSTLALSGQVLFQILKRLKPLSENPKIIQLSKLLVKLFKSHRMQTQPLRPIQVGYNCQIQRTLQSHMKMMPTTNSKQCISKFINSFFLLQRKLQQQSFGELSMYELNKHSKRICMQKLFVHHGIDYELFDDNQELYDLRNCLSVPIYYKVVMTYFTAMNKVNITSSKNKLSYSVNYLVDPSVIKPNQKEEPTSIPAVSYTVTYNLSKRHWECNCQKQFWLGLPCLHIMKVIIMHGGSIEYYISGYWKLRQVFELKNSINFHPNEDGTPKEDFEKEDFNIMMQAANKRLFYLQKQTQQDSFSEQFEYDMAMWKS